MTPIPRAALILGLAGVLPFAFGALLASGLVDAHMGSPGQAGSYPLIVPRDGTVILLRYGTIILAFMSGVLWGFAARAEGERATAGYALSVIPALYVFFMPGHGPVSGLTNLAFGFAGLLVLDWQFARWGMTPAWWLRLRLLLTALVLACLAVGIGA